MTIHLDVQYAVQDSKLPSVNDFEQWAAAIPSDNVDVTACIRIVDEEEAKRLNKEFRNINKATNVLSFPADIPKEVGINFLGDVIICAPLVCKEAVAQDKNPNSHWAHLLIHGILHLQGYDHNNVEQAEEMENLEIKILEEIGIKNPY